MPRPAVLFAVTVTVATFGPQWCCAPTARADYVPNVVSSQPFASAPFRSFLWEPAGDSSQAIGAGPADPLAKASPDSVPPASSPFIHFPRCLPFTTGSSTGGAGGSTTGAGQWTGAGSPTAGIPPIALLDVDKVVGILSLNETSCRPPAFKSRLFRPPRKG